MTRALVYAAYACHRSSLRSSARSHTELQVNAVGLGQGAVLATKSTPKTLMIMRINAGGTLEMCSRTVPRPAGASTLDSALMMRRASQAGSGA